MCLLLFADLYYHYNFPFSKTMNISLMTRLRPRLLHLSFLTDIHIRTWSPKYFLIVEIPSSSSQWDFFPSSNTTFHQTKSLLSEGHRFPICNLLSHILPLLCSDHPILFAYLHHILQTIHLLIQLWFPQLKYKDQLSHNGCFFQLPTGHLSGQPTHQFTSSLFSLVICESNISKCDHPTLHS